jgi:glycosyltransferase involved in cell wall biosynthesis
VITCFDENQPGYLDFSYRIAALAKEYQLTVVSLQQITQAELMHAQVKYKVIATGKGKLGWLTYLFKCASFIKNQKPDLVMLLHSGAAPISLLVRKIPTVLYWNEHPSHLVYSPKKYAPIRQTLSKILFHLLFMGARSASLVMPIGEDHRNDLIAHGVRPSKVELIYMGVLDDFLLNRKNTEPPKFIDSNYRIQLIYIGSVSVDRGRDVMLDAMSQLVRQEVSAHLSIIGATEEQLSFCQKRAKALGIEKNITLLGRISGNQIPAYLEQADIGICLWEKSAWVEFNPPTKLFEYLVAGLPVLASNIRTHTRYIKHWNNGIIFDYNATSLADSVTELVARKQDIPLLKHNAEQSGAQYLWSRIEPEFLEALRKLIHNKVASI